MNAQVNVRLVDALRVFSRFDGRLVAFAGIIVLIGWAIESEVLMRILPGLVAMNPLTAICFVCAGVSLVCFWTAQPHAAPSILRIGQILAAFLIGVGLLKLVDYLFGSHFGLDQLLFRERLDLDQAGVPNRMAPNTALNFILTGTALALLNSPSGRHPRAIQNLSLVVAFHSLLALLGYIYSARYLYGVGSFIPMALHTATLFLLLSIGLLFAQPHYGAVALLVSNTPGGITARRLLPVAFGVPALLGALRLWGERVGIYGSEFGVTIMVLLCIATFIALIWWNAVLLNRTDEQRTAAEAALKQAHDNLEVRVQERTAELIQVNDTLRTEMAERHRAEQQIREQAELLNKAHEAIVVRDFSQRIVFWNKGAERLYGWTATDVVGKNGEAAAFQESEKLREATQKIVQNGEWSGELQRKTKAGQDVIVESHWTLVRDEAGKPKCILTIDTDITEKKKLEEQFLRSQRMDSIGALAGGIAHDLNNALVPILVGSELMRENKDDEAEREHLLGLITTSAQRCSQMVKQILSFARGARGETGSVPLRHLIGEMEKIAGDTFPKSISIHANVPKDLWNIEGDATELHQVLMNLCVNARDAMPQGGELTISAQNIPATNGTDQSEKIGGPRVILSVADTGTGIPPEVLKRIFEPFFTTKAPDKGTGLGLSTVAAIIKRHEGTLEVKSEVGKGTEFIISLPALSTHIAEAKSESSSLPVGHGELVLLVDDEKLALELAKTTLENYGYRVLTAANGMEAVICFGAHRSEIRLLVTDTDMPFMDGINAIRAIQDVESTIPIIMASGSKRDPEQLRKIDTTCVTTLSKPYGVEQLLNGVANALKNRNGTAKAAVQHISS